MVHVERAWILPRPLHMDCGSRRTKCPLLSEVKGREKSVRKGWGEGDGVIQYSTMSICCVKMAEFKARLLESRLTLNPDYKLTQVFISLIENVFKANFRLVVKKVKPKLNNKNIFEEDFLESKFTLTQD